MDCAIHRLLPFVLSAMTTSPRHLVLLAAPLALLALASCGDDSSSGSGDNGGGSTAAPAATTPAPTPSTGDANGGGYAVPPTEAPASGVALADSSLGKILVDQDGLTLYGFMNDTPTSSTCGGSCTDTWPPFIQTGDELTLADGVDEDDFGTITRSDGSKQVTFYGHPLYHYAADTKAGDTKGQGIGDVWYALDAEGKYVDND